MDGSAFQSSWNRRSGRRRGIARVLALAVFCCCFVASTVLIAQPSTSASSFVGTRYTTRSSRVAPGVRLLRIYDRRGPNRIKVLRMHPERTGTLDVALSNNRLPGYETTSSMARRHGAIAAINGDFSVPASDPRGSGRPVNIFAEDGSLKTSPLIWGRNFAISHDEKRTFITHTQLKARLVQLDSAEAWRVTRWNERVAARRELSASTPAGGTISRPPQRSCSVRLYPKGALRWQKSLFGVDRRHVVNRVRCSFRRLPRRGGVVISARRRTPAARSIRRTLERGEVIQLGWKMEGWPGILDTIGGNPTLLEKGVRTVEPCSGSYFCYRNPRTGIGVTGDGTLLLVAVDGRRRDSVGLTPVGFARLFRYLGARSALNLDGGGSTTMVVKDRIVNQPSDSAGERSVGSAILILPRRDQGEPDPTAVSTSASGSDIMPTDTDMMRTESLSDPLPLPEAGTLAPTKDAGNALQVIDPASTGGMLDALRGGLLGKARAVTGRALPRVLGTFRDFYDQRGQLRGKPTLELPALLRR